MILPNISVQCHQYSLTHAYGAASRPRRTMTGQRYVQSCGNEPIDSPKRTKLEETFNLLVHV